MSDTPDKAQVPEATSSSAKEEEANTVRAIIGAYTMRIRSISRCAKEYIHLAQETCQKWQDHFIQEIISTARSQSAEAVAEMLVGSLTTGDLHYHIAAPHSEILSQSLLISGFSAFDAFVGMLVTRLYMDEPELISPLRIRH